jgi:hypothetical protein
MKGYFTMTGDLIATTTSGTRRLPAFSARTGTSGSTSP